VLYYGLIIKYVLEDFIMENNNHLTGNTASLCLSNFGGIQIKVNDSGDSVQYKYYNDPIKEAEIEYLEDSENRTGYADDEENKFQPAFRTDAGQVYFIGEFMRNNF